jgi:hypothetical protein
MKKGRFTESQIVAALKKQESGILTSWEATLSPYAVTNNCLIGKTLRNLCLSRICK